jgi:hypothetical protein
MDYDTLTARTHGYDTLTARTMVWRLAGMPSGKYLAATINRLLQPTRAGMASTGLSATKAGSDLRSSIAVRRAGQEYVQVPGFIEADLVAHCGQVLVGEFARTLTATDVFTGWTENVVIRNSAYKRVSVFV